MTQKFRDTISDLWAFANLGNPRFAKDGTISLSFDDVLLDFRASDSEQETWIEADAGRISDQGTSADQLSHILGLSFALLASHNVLVTLSGERIKVSGSFSLRVRNVSGLADMISDLVSATQTLRAITDTVPGGRAASNVNLETRPEDFVVFQP